MDPLPPIDVVKANSLLNSTPEERAELFKALTQLDKTLMKSVKEMGRDQTKQRKATRRKGNPLVGSTAGIGDLDLAGKAGEVIRAEKVQVHCRVVFLKLGEIDTVNERFAADAFVQARWREPTMDGESQDEDYEMVGREGLWDPKLYVENVMGELKESMWYIVSYNKKGEATICQRRRVKGTFFERMELNQFPFDTQDLTVTLTTERGELEIDLIHDQTEISTVNVQSFVDEQEWNLHKHINSWTRVTTNAYKSTRHKHPALSISCTATRRSRFFIWNIILVMMFICTLVFTTFTVDQALPQNRIQLSFILLLSNITFKFTVNQTLPKVSYLTYLDKYILISMAILCLVCVWHAIVGQIVSWADADFASEADIYAFVAFLVLYVAFNAIFFTWSKCLVSKRSREYMERDLVQKQKLKEMESSGAAGANHVSPIKR